MSEVTHAKGKTMDSRATREGQVLYFAVLILSNA